MLDASARLLSVLALLQTRRDWSSADMAQRLHVTERTVRRDIDRLRQLGYTVDAQPGVGGGYRLGFGSGVPPLLLNEDEAVAVGVALRNTTSGLAGVAEASVQALIKLQALLPSALRRRVELLHETVLPLTGPGPLADVEVLLVAAAAARDNQQLHLDYRDHHGVSTRRVVEPHRVVRTADRWYLLAWDIDRDDWRTFRLDRLTPRTPAGRRFTPRPIPDADTAAAVAQGITTAVYPVRCRLTVHAPADVVGELFGPTRAQIRSLNKSTCEVVGGSVSLNEMALWVARLGFDVVIHEPPQLIDEVAAIAGRLTRSVAASLAENYPAPD